MTKQKLIEENMNLVYFTINKYFPRYSNDEDMIQTGMVGLCTAAQYWNESKGSFSTYAIRIIRNQLCNEHNYRNKHKKTLSLDYEYDGDFNEGEVLTLGDMIAGQEDVDFDYSQEFCDTLSPHQLELVTLRKQGYSINEIGRRLGIKKQAVWNSLRYIKRRWNKYNGQVNRK